MAAAQAEVVLAVVAVVPKVAEAKEAAQEAAKEVVRAAEATAEELGEAREAGGSAVVLMARATVGVAMAEEGAAAVMAEAVMAEAVERAAVAPEAGRVEPMAVVVKEVAKEVAATAAVARAVAAAAGGVVLVVEPSRTSRDGDEPSSFVAVSAMWRPPVDPKFMGAWFVTFFTKGKQSHDLEFQNI